jgi:hypothetical protein
MSSKTLVCRVAHAYIFPRIQTLLARPFGPHAPSLGCSQAARRTGFWVDRADPVNPLPARLALLGSTGSRDPGPRSHWLFGWAGSCHRFIGAPHVPTTRTIEFVVGDCAHILRATQLPGSFAERLANFCSSFFCRQPVQCRMPLGSVYTLVGWYQQHCCTHASTTVATAKSHAPRPVIKPIAIALHNDIHLATSAWSGFCVKMPLVAAPGCSCPFSTSAVCAWCRRAVLVPVRAPAGPTLPRRSPSSQPRADTAATGCRSPEHTAFVGAASKLPCYTTASAAAAARLSGSTRFERVFLRRGRAPRVTLWHLARRGTALMHCGRSAPAVLPALWTQPAPAPRQPAQSPLAPPRPMHCLCLHSSGFCKSL